MMDSLQGWSTRRLRAWLGLFFLALAVPTGMLVYHAYGQLKWEAYHRQQALAEELASRIDRHFQQLIGTEEARSFTDYAFLVLAGDPSANFLQRSALAAYPVASDIPGLIGHFQVDAAGDLGTPLLPDAETDPAEFGVSNEELGQRLALAGQLRRILGENRLVETEQADKTSERSAFEDSRHRDGDTEDGASASLAGSGSGKAAPRTLASSREAEITAPQVAFDQLSGTFDREPEKQKASTTGAAVRVEDLKLDQRYRQARPMPSDDAVDIPRQKKSARMERSALPEPQQTAPPAAPVSVEEPGAEARAKPGSPIRIFESEIDPFEFALLDSGHFVLFRKVWRDGQRYIQGALVDQQPLLRDVVESALRETVLAQTSDLVVAWQGRILSVFSGQAMPGYVSRTRELDGAALHQRHLSAPLGGMELLFTINRLPSGPAGTLLNWLAAVLALVLCGGIYGMYRLGVRQIGLARQQQDFVSAVSHELKTPLTSIRMYGEILRQGWASEGKKRKYYDYIHDESERLSRLIGNVLQLARMTRNDLQLDMKPVSAGALMEGIRSRVASQAELAGFAITVDCANADAAAIIKVDPDAFSQIVINLVDNAIKFSARAETRAIEIHCSAAGDDEVRFSVRDYGPGVPPDQVKKIFGLFYRSGNELTRETAGTGIGLALVHQLARAMNGKVDVLNREPGAEFRVFFPAAPDPAIPE